MFIDIFTRSALHFQHFCASSDAMAIACKMRLLILVFFIILLTGAS
jgi:hypothetical protein